MRHRGPRALNLADPVDRSAAFHPSNVWLPVVGRGSTTLFDVVGRNHGTLTNGPTWNGSDTPGLGAVVFDGSDDRVTYTALTAASYTAAVRFVRGRALGDVESIWGDSSVGNILGPGWTSQHTYYCRFASTDGGNELNLSAGSRGLGVWQTLVAVYRPGGTSSLTLNGVSVTVGTGGSGAGRFDRLGYNGTPAYPFQGQIQSAWYWPTALSDSQAAAFCAEADLGYPTFLRRVSPVSWFVGAGGGGTSDAAGSAAGTSTASAVGASTAAAAGSSSGTATAAGVGASTADAVGSAAGSATAAAVGASTSEAVGTAAGTATAAATGTSSAEAVGSASGVATAAGTGASAAEAAGTSAGTSTAAAVGVGATEATGAATGTSTASAVGAAIASAVGTCVGLALAAGVGASTAAAAGTAAGTSTAAGYSAGAGDDLLMIFFF